MQAKRWKFLPHDAARIARLSRDAQVPPVVAQLLVSRGLYQAAEVRQFLDCKLNTLRDPSLLPGIDAAAERLTRAITDAQPIVIYGDYDADGMTATAILYNVLKLLRADVSYHIPNRLEDSYGLSIPAIEKLAEREKRLVVTVDCGIASVAEAERCRELGIELIITDHHQFGEQLPAATALVHPRLPGTSYPFGELCGAGVAFKLAWALCVRASGSTRVSDAMRDALMRALGLAAIGTIADVVPLLDENRILVSHGLRALKKAPPLGLTELLRVIKLHDRPALTSEDVAFMIAPRLNAAGRLGQAPLGVELLTTTNPERAVALADYLHQLNGNRETLERSVYVAAHKQVKEHLQLRDDPALVVAGQGWHVGVIGVVAGRLAERYARPVAVVALDALGTKPGVGSARAGGPINLHESLKDCSHVLESCGGHAAAAGLRVRADRLELFREEFKDAVARRAASLDCTPEVVIDAEAPFGQLTLETVTQIESLAPFGQGNPRPVLSTGRVELTEPPRKIGNGERHLAANLRQDGIPMRSVAFGQADWYDALAAQTGTIDIAFRPVINEHNGYRRVEVQLVDWRPSA